MSTRRIGFILASNGTRCVGQRVGQGFDIGRLGGGLGYVGGGEWFRDARGLAGSETMFSYVLFHALSFSATAPSPPENNARNEAFNSVVRPECLTHHYFFGLEDPSVVLEFWKEDYNNERPHGKLGQIPPVESRPAWAKSMESARLQKMI
jgi:hypothetical protein